MHKEYNLKNNDDFDVQRVIHNDIIISSMLFNINSIVKEISIFWKEIRNDKSSQQINEISELISLRMRELKIDVIKMETKCKQFSMNLLEFYVDFLENVVFNEQECFELKEKLIEMKKYNQFTVENLDLLVNNQNLDEISSIIVSGSIDETGKIEELNSNFCKLFMYEKDDLQRRNISKILPWFIGQYHDGFIRRYLETAKENIINQTRILLGKNSKGFIFPIFLIVKVVPNLDKSVRFIAILNKISTKHSFYNLNLKYNIDNPVILIQCTIEGNVIAISKSVIILLLYLKCLIYILLIF